MKVFVEEQRFTQLWLHVVLLISFIVPTLFLIKEYIEPKHSEKNFRIELLIILGSMVLVYGIIFSLKLKTRIDEKGIQFRFVPFHFSYKLITWNEIEAINTRKYDAITEYGGWGIKGGILWRKNKGVAYNVKGNIGVQLALKNGKKILIGTQKETEVKRILETYMNKTKSYES